MSNLRKLRDYQSRINKAVNKFLITPELTRGQVYSPTGSGKTECFGHTVHELPDIIKSTPNQGLNIAVVHPRIALSQEQLSRFKEVFGSRYRFTSFHSGAHVKGEEAYLEFNTTNVDELIQTIDQETRTHITFSSYDSFHKIAHIEFDLLILDEAHNLTQRQYLEPLRNMAAKKAIFYTATPINKDFEDEESAGMNNPELFGEVIATVEPKELILRGVLVPPLMHFLRASTTQKGDDVDTVEIVAESFRQQQLEMTQYGMPFVQMLVTSRGLEDHRKVESELVQLWENIGAMVPVYVIEAGDARKNGKTYLKGNRFAVLQEIKTLEQSCIVMHYDTLSEGIDISSLTGACILRRMSKSKLLQTIGRCGRPYTKDLNAQFEVTDLKTRMKPVSVITLPIVDGTHIGGVQAKDICDAFIAGGYGDLSDYLTESDKKTMSEKKDLFDFGDDPQDRVLSHVVDWRVDRDVQKLVEMGFVF